MLKNCTALVSFQIYLCRSFVPHCASPYLCLNRNIHYSTGVYHIHIVWQREGQRERERIIFMPRARSFTSLTMKNDHCTLLLLWIVLFYLLALHKQIGSSSSSSFSFSRYEYFLFTPIFFFCSLLSLSQFKYSYNQNNNFGFSIFRHFSFIYLTNTNLVHHFRPLWVMYTRW